MPRNVTIIAYNEQAKNMKLESRIDHIELSMTVEDCKFFFTATLV